MNRDRDLPRTTPAPLPAPQIRVAILCNHSFGASTLYRGLFPYLRAEGISCEMVVGDDEFLHGDDDFAGVPVHVIPMAREPAPLRDMASLGRLIRFFTTHRFDVVHVSTPKAAFLGSIAARMTGHRNILFVVRTRIYEYRTGIDRKRYELADWLISSLSRVVAPVSREMGEAMIASRICPRAKVRFFGKGSSNGINIRRFAFTDATAAQGRALRRAAGIPEDALVLLSAGRLARDKGLAHLSAVMDRADQVGNPVWLIIAGPEDSREPTEGAVLEALTARPNVVRLGYQADLVPLYAAADLFLLPSQREGFPNVALEAQAMGLPVVAFDTSGVREAVENGATGFLAPFGDGAAFADLTIRLLDDARLRSETGQAGIERVRTQFSNEMIWRDLTATLKELAQR